MGNLKINHVAVWILVVVNLIVAFLSAIAMTYSLAWLFKRLNIDTTLKGLLYSLFFCVVYFFLQTITIGLFSLRPLALSFIDGGMYLVNFVIAGLLLGSWKKYEVAASEVEENS